MRAIFMILLACLSLTLMLHAGELREKIGIYVTPNLMEGSYFDLSYEDALDSLKGSASTVWILEGWKEIEKSPGAYNWSKLDRSVNEARKRGFNAGLRLQVVLCGNDANKNFVAVSKVPKFYDQYMGSDEFREKACAFFSAAAERYKDKVKYIAIGNSMNNYFDNNKPQWEGFKKAYDPIVRAIKAKAPGMLVLSDINTGDKYEQFEEHVKKYLEFFGRSEDDAVGFVFYFIVKAYYGDFKNFNSETMKNVLDRLQKHTGKKIFILETSCFSTHPKNGNDMTKVQSSYVNMLYDCARDRDYIMGVSWWLMYDGKNEPQVPWDLKAFFGFFDEKMKAKPAWEIWKERYNKGN